MTDSYNPRNGVGNGHESGLGDTPGTQPTEPLPSSSFPYYPTGQNSEGSGQRGNDPDGRRPSWPGQADGSERGQARPGGTEALSPFSPFAARPDSTSAYASGSPTASFIPAESTAQEAAGHTGGQTLTSGQSQGGPYADPFPSGAHSGFAFDANAGVKPGKQKRSWTTAALAAATMAGMLLGSLIGGVTGFALGDQDHSASVQEQKGTPEATIPSAPNAPDSQKTPGQNTAVQQGKPVKSAPGVMLINSRFDNGEGAGTGMVVDKSGIVLTNYHVVHGSSKVKVTDPNSGAKYTATVVGHNAARDVAVLKIDDPPKKLETVKISSKQIKKDDSVTAIGNGSGQGYLTALDGKVTGTNVTINAQDSLNSENVDKLTGLIQTDADVVQGYSGGPLMNSKGEVIGLTTAASTGKSSAEVNGYAIPIKDAMDIVNKVKSGKGGDGTVIGRNAALGVSITTNRASNDQGISKGVTVREVISGSGAEKAGIEVGDVITHINGEKVSKASDLSDKVQNHKIGEEVTLTIVKSDGSQTDVKVKLGESSVN